tara:strand:- start:1391 stop:1738 length:348 start_codon:yes stop_codon:yes gene_type:complete
MEKRILKNGIEEMSENLKNRIMLVTQQLLQHDKSKDGDFLTLYIKDNGMEFTKEFFQIILEKTVKEFNVEETEDNHSTLHNIRFHLGITEGSQFIKEIKEKSTNGKRKKINTKTA